MLSVQAMASWAQRLGSASRNAYRRLNPSTTLNNTLTAEQAYRHAMGTVYPESLRAIDPTARAFYNSALTDSLERTYAARAALMNNYARMRNYRILAGSLSAAALGANVQRPTLTEELPARYGTNFGFTGDWI